MRLAAAVAIAALLTPLAVDAAEPSVEFGLDMGWLIWGGARTRGAPSNPTGGLVFVPSARVSLPAGSSWIDVQYTQAPMILAPGAKQSGFVDANDVGFEVHNPSKAVGIALAGTVAPAYGAFCNVEWCKLEGLLAWGAVVRGYLNAHDGDGGRAFLLTGSARLLYAKPEAWTWPGLPEEHRQIMPVTFMITAGGGWRW